MVNIPRTLTYLEKDQNIDLIKECPVPFDIGRNHSRQYCISIVWPRISTRPRQPPHRRCRAHISPTYPPAAKVRGSQQSNLKLEVGAWRSAMFHGCQAAQLRAPSYYGTGTVYNMLYCHYPCAPLRSLTVIYTYTSNPGNIETTSSTRNPPPRQETPRLDKKFPASTRNPLHSHMCTAVASVVMRREHRERVSLCIKHV
jgi:hypothetical protein